MQYHEHEPELTECRNCGSTFDLSRQHYYDELCPPCEKKEHSPITTWRSCVACSTMAPSDQLQLATVRGRTGTERLSVCSEGCREHMQTNRHAPRGPDADKGDDPYVTDAVLEVNRLLEENEALEQRIDELESKLE